MVDLLQRTLDVCENWSGRRGGTRFGRNGTDLVKQEVKKEFKRFSFSVEFEAVTP